MKKNEQPFVPVSGSWSNLDGKEHEKLEKLCSSWSKKDPRDLPSEKLTINDLRLLLENDSPLRRIICKIATIPGADTINQGRGNQGEGPQDLAPVHQELPGEKQERDNNLLALQEKERLLGNATNEILDLKKERDTLYQKLLDTKSELKRLQQAEIPALAFLRSDADLGKSLGLSGLAGDGQDDLIRAVAVLSQWENIRRLWDTLKARCENEHRAATLEESGLLKTAIGWHNYNWPSKPYRLVTPHAGQNFDFETQQRAASTPTGDRIEAIWLPGIVAGNGDIMQKALVATH